RKTTNHGLRQNGTSRYKKNRAHTTRGRGGGGGGEHARLRPQHSGGCFFAKPLCNRRYACHTASNVEHGLVLSGRVSSYAEQWSHFSFFFLGGYIRNTSSKIQQRGYIFGMFHFLSIKKTLHNKHFLCYLGFPNSRATIREIRRLHRGYKFLPRRRSVLDTDPLFATQSTQVLTITRLRRSYSYLHPDAGLDRHPEHLPRDQLLELFRQH
ncbi:unnamed protein product, partial [Ectocarpus sp. 13 AM-2016]